MTKVITYGTYDLLHRGHIRLLERAKSLGDYLIVGITAEDFDKARGKINVQQSLMERVEAVRATGLADEIIVEEYEGQKIDDIRRYGVDIFTVGDDWQGKFDYLNEYCKVVYLKRTEGVSSSEIRAEQKKLRLGLVGDQSFLVKYARESGYVNGMEISGVFTESEAVKKELPQVAVFGDFDQMLALSDAVYIASRPQLHYEQVRKALLQNKHVLCESPVALSAEQSRELFRLAEERRCVLMDSLKTAFSTAYARLLLLVKAGRIGQVYSVDATCTSLQAQDVNSWDCICLWGPTGMLPVFDLLGTGYRDKTVYTHFDGMKNDLFSKINFLYDHAVASVKVGSGVKSEGDLVISGTKGYVYVPSPWWKTDYFEIRYENPADNMRYFYQLDGEGIRYELVAFKRAVETEKNGSYIGYDTSIAFSQVIEDFYNDRLIEI